MPTKAPSVRFITLGCAKNEVDSARMRSNLLAAGYKVLEDPPRSQQGIVDGSIDHDNPPDVVIINTCSFIADATQESIDTILEIVGISEELANRDSRDNRGFFIVVCGCMPSRYGEELATEIPEVDRFVDVKSETQIVQVLDELTGFDKSRTVSDARQAVSDASRAAFDKSRAASDASQAAFDASRAALDASRAAQTEITERKSARDKHGEFQVPEHTELEAPEHAKSEVLSSRQPWAYVKISDGCSRFCSFCTIPYIRGPYQSRRAKEILSEINSLVAAGAKEIVLIGQDTGIWGEDFGASSADWTPLKSPDLASLMQEIAQRYPNIWLRVMYLQPERVDQKLLRVMASNPNICNYLDIPLQHCNSAVLRNMNRSGSSDSYLDLLHNIRKTFDQCAIRTTLISGFPGETDSQAAELEDFIAKAGFDFAGVFEYSREEGTVAAQMDAQVPSEVAVARAQRLRDIADATSLAALPQKLGQIFDVLVCGIDNSCEEYSADWNLEDSDFEGGEQDVPLWGRTMFQAPDVDSTVSFMGSASLLGSVVKVRITGMLGYDLEGELA